ncbi:MAG: trans-aconitate 2-methyltransferase [Candidatus Lokiarchaeia archaeon]
MYKWDAEDYHKSSSEQQKWARELILKLKLKGNERVLDVGCGDGKVAAELAQQVPDGSVVGIDNSEQLIRFAQMSFPPDRYPNLTFEPMEAKQLIFDAEFDVVFSNACLHWIIDHLPVLKGIKKSLKPSGRILLQMGGKGNAAKILEVLKPMIESGKWSSYFTNFSFPYAFYGSKEYKEWLEQVGLKSKRIELIPKHMVHKGKGGLVAWIRTTWLPYTQRVPEELREEFIEELVDKYIKINPLDSEGFVHVPMMRLEVEAVNDSRI